MNERDFDQAARAWLDEGPNRMSDGALLAALEEVHVTRQRRAPWAGRGAPRLQLFARVALAAVVVAAVGVAAANVLPGLRGGPSVGGPTPAATDAPFLSPSPTASSSDAPGDSADDPWALPFDLPLTKTFVSPTNGLTQRNIDRAGASWATVSWTPPEQIRPSLGAGGRIFDSIDTGYGAVFNVASAAVPAGVPLDDWIDQAVASAAATPTCMQPRREQAEIAVDGRSGRLSDGCAHQFLVTVVAGDRLYMLELIYGEGPEEWARQFFDAWLATIRLTPETAGPIPDPELVARGSFVEHDWGFVDLEATRQGANVTGEMLIDKDWRGAGLPVNVTIQCARTTADGRVVIAGDVSDGPDETVSGIPIGANALVELRLGSPHEGVVGMTVSGQEIIGDCETLIDTWLTAPDQWSCSCAGHPLPFLDDRTVEFGPGADPVASQP